MLASLSKRRAELDNRARALDMRENVLAATERRVDEKIATLKQLQTQVTTLIGQRDSAQEKQVAALVKTYSAMKPKDAARIFDGLSDDVLVPVAQEMKSDALAPVLAAMSPTAAQKLTVKLASKLNPARNRRRRADTGAANTNRECCACDHRDHAATCDDTAARRAARPGRAATRHARSGEGQEWLEARISRAAAKTGR